MIKNEGDFKVKRAIKIRMGLLAAGLMGMLLMLVACGDATQADTAPSNLTSAPLPTVTPPGNGPTPMLGLATTTSGVSPVALTTIQVAAATTNVPGVAVTATPVPAPVIIKRPAPPVNLAPPNKDEGDNKDKSNGNDDGGKKPKK